MVVASYKHYAYHTSYKKSKLQPPTNGFKVHTYGYEKYRNNVCRQIHDGAYTYGEREGEIEQANAVSE